MNGTIDYMIGDSVVLLPPPDERPAGYSPFTEVPYGTVIGFQELAYGRGNYAGRRPGIYVNRESVAVRRADGSVAHIPAPLLMLASRELYRQRRAEAGTWKPDTDAEQWLSREPIRELPDTPFWEGDMVVVPSRGLALTAVHEIDYLAFERKGEKPFGVRALDGSVGYCSEDELELWVRGRFWRHAHSEHIDFVDSQDEAKFLLQSGQAVSVCSVQNGHDWPIREVIREIQAGRAHAFIANSGPSLLSPIVTATAIRVFDPIIAERIASKALTELGANTN